MIVKNLEKKEHSSVMLQVEIDPDQFFAGVETAYKKAKNGIFVPGFRKGKAPLALIEGMYGADVFYNDAVQVIAPDAFEFAVEDAKLDVVGMPSIVDYNVDDNRALTITFMADVYPEVTLGQIRGIEGEFEEPVVTDQMVEDAVKEEQKRAARYVDVERPVRSGDTIVFDFQGFADGEAFPGGTAENYNLEIGSGSFIPGFEDQLIGMELGQDGEVNVTFPENYDPKMAGRDATFKVKIHSIREAQMPELDDEFAKDVSEFDTFEEYRKSVYDKLLADATETSEAAYKNDVLSKAVANMTAEVPAAMINDKLEEFLRSYTSRMGIPGNVSREDMFKALGVTEDMFMQLMGPNARKQALVELLLDKIIEDEKIEATQEEKDEFWKSVEDDYGPEASKVREMIDEKLMEKELCRKRAGLIIYESAVKVAPKKEEQAEETAEEKAED